MEGVEIPPFFTCPISLQMMRDPVTVCTGITYDRESMEQWLFSYKKKVCPVSKQPLDDASLTPNHTLRRLIQAWCVDNAIHGVERIPTPKPPVDSSTVLDLLRDIQSPSLQTQLRSLLQLKSIVSESDRNRECVRSAGTTKRLAALIQALISTQQRTAKDRVPDQEGNVYTEEKSTVIREALDLIITIGINEEELKDLAMKGVDVVGALTLVLLHGDRQSRMQSCMVMKVAFEDLNPVFLMNIRGDLLMGLVNIVRDRISKKATKEAIKLLIELSKWGRNRIKVVEFGAVPLLIELLIDSSERQTVEMVLWLADMLCGCAEGRAAMSDHSAGIAAVSRKMMRVSHVANDRAVRILYSLWKCTANPRLAQEMLQVGAVSKLCLLLQIESADSKMKEKAKEMLRMQSNVWRNSPCVPHHLFSGYPSK